jgi:hypothetical protein
MPVYDPKLLKAIDGTKLIGMSKGIGIKNADKVSKESLIQAYMEQVEKLVEEKSTKVTEGVITFYNSLLDDLHLSEETTEVVEPVEEPEVEVTEVVEPVEEVTTQVEDTPPAPVAKPTPIKKPTAPTPIKKPVTTTPTTPVKKTPPAPVAKPTPVEKKPVAPKVVKEKEPKPPAPPKVKKYTRGQAYGECVREMAEGTFDDLITKANEKYIEHGGTDNMNESKFFGRFGESILRGLGIVEISEDNKSFKVII